MESTISEFRMAVDPATVFTISWQGEDRRSRLPSWDLNLKCPPQAHVFEHLVARQWCSLGKLQNF